jgi:hypothetical protein
MGRSAKSRNVFSRLNTLAIKTPRGLVSAKTTNRKNPICSQPFAVMSELLGLEQSRKQVAQQQDADDDQ